VRTLVLHDLAADVAHLEGAQVRRLQQAHPMPTPTPTIGHCVR
jgi:hypothetical protein